MLALRLSLFCCFSVFLGINPGFAQDRPLPPGDAAQHMTLPPGFRATLFAGEPDVRQPIAFTFDDQGRLWVVECYSYPNWLTRGQGHDRILIFEDKNGTGHFDSCKVFWDKGTNISGIQLGFGGVWVCAIPNFLFIPVRDGADAPAGPPRVLLDGWSMEAKHNVFNSLTWGPDGWLYCCNGILATSHVGKPGTPERERIPFNCGVWRYHPTRHVFEVVAHGTTNPWGLDFDDSGQMFITNCVIHHLWHVTPGAHFQRMYGQDFNPYLFDLMHSCADHIHWAGGSWTESRGGKGEHDRAGGGHAHVGAMVYLGDNWPDSYRQGLFTCNLHGNRVNHDVLERTGSGYVAHHGKDFLLANDPWFRGITIQYGPDGGVFVSDWCDTGECHNYDRVDRTNGRIYKVTYGKVTPFQGDLNKLSDQELVKFQLHKNDWFGRHARRILQERALTGNLAAGTTAALVKMLSAHADVTRRLRALWALYTIGGVDEKLLLEQLESPHAALRGWAVRLALEDKRCSTAMLRRLGDLAQNDTSALVRLELASALQRLPLGKRWAIAEALLAHGEDVHDANLPLMIWYGIEPLVAANRARFVDLIRLARIPLLREFVARRATDRVVPPELVRLLGEATDATVQADLLRGLYEAFTGWRHADLPPGWKAVRARLANSPNSEVRDKMLFLSVLFDDPESVERCRRLAFTFNADPTIRQQAMDALIVKRNPDLVPVLQQLLADRTVRRSALRGLAAFADASTPTAILTHYRSFSEEEKAYAIQTLASRPAYALVLLDAMERKLVAREDVSAFTARHLLALKDRQVSARLAQVWGTIRPASQEKAGLMARYKQLLTPEYLKQANRNNGRRLFAQACASCHTLFGEGGKIGPELTGSQRANLDYILENVLDPSAVVASDYQVTFLQTRDGRVISGIIKQENEHAVTVQTQNEQLHVPLSEIEERTKSAVSMMPEGLLAPMKDAEVRDLIAYLSSPAQVPLKRPTGK
jgi:putative membrane-bound dehydrogenase-like protein